MGLTSYHYDLDGHDGNYDSARVSLHQMIKTYLLDDFP